MRSLTFIDVERIERVSEDEVALQMDEDAFRAFYDRTSRSLCLYLTRMTRDAARADDLVQETYYRFLRTERDYASDAHRRNYLFRIATNLVRDGGRRQRADAVHLADDHEPDALQAPGDEGERAVRRADLHRAMARLKPRERAMLWLAYTEGSSHVEIAESLGIKTSSVKALLFRARRRLALLLKGDSRKETVR
jgi:RNA polymerase sigma-70 factor (ECF subfamily)